jgi:hypothetical protein
VDLVKTGGQHFFQLVFEHLKTPQIHEIHFSKVNMAKIEGFVFYQSYIDTFEKPPKIAKSTFEKWIWSKLTVNSLLVAPVIYL